MNFFEYIILAEFSVIILFVIFSYVYYFFHSMYIRRRLKIEKKIEDKLINLVNKRELIIDPIFRVKSYYAIVLDIIHRFDRDLKHPHWSILRSHLINETLLPVARRNFNNNNWLNRLKSAQIFALKSQKQDEEKVKKLIDDSIPIISFYASAAAIAYHSSYLINALIDRMSQERRLALTIYLQGFSHAVKHVRIFLVERLKKESNDYVKTACYRALLLFKEPILYSSVESDIYSPTLELAIQAVKYLAYSEEKQSIPVLVKLLKDGRWQIRMLAVESLGRLKAKEQIKEISALLHDEAWWVRYHAARSLFHLGSEGIRILKDQDPHYDRYAYDISSYVLSAPEE